jgi:murein DD-endopeptidase MepM/ murein hydrolase activator NlpD/urea transporter
MAAVMSAAPPDRGEGRSWDHARAVAAGEGLLRAYAHVLFSRSPIVGLLVLGATATVPRAFVAGAVAVLAATATAELLGLDPGAIRGGDYGYNAILVGLGLAQTFAGGAPLLSLILFAAAASVIVTAAMRAWLSGAALPVLSLPFLAVFHLAIGAAAAGGATPIAQVSDPSALAALVPGGVALFVRSLGGLFFLPRIDAGLIVLAALILHSRIAASLAASAFTFVTLLAAASPALPPGATMEGLGYNGMLTAVAIGGVYFVPSASSFMLALTGSVVSTLLAVGLAGPLARVGAPVLILPFNLAVLLLLFALRQRVHDLRPKSVDFLPGTPEENLAYFRTRVRRFEQLYPVAIHLPFRGRWTCTQGRDGAFTHQGIWRFAFDFEVRDADGRLAEGEGTLPEHYHCHRLPVLAAADGTVIAVEGGLPDNAVGAIDLDHNWGNHVIVQHGIGLYSLSAHLARGSVKVRRGDIVRRGEVIGLAGSSGRSPRPHLHFHLQGTPLLGAATIPCRFADVVVVKGEEARVSAAAEPALDDVVESLPPGGDLASWIALSHGDAWTFRAGAGGGVERLTPDVDLYGRLLVRSRDLPATLFYGMSDTFFTAYDVLGARGSVLHLIRAALPRVPLAAEGGIRWTDHLPARPFRPWIARVILDLLSPFLPRDGIEMDFGLRRDGALLVVEGCSRRRDRRGAPIVRTRAHLAKGVGPVRVEVSVRGRTRAAERVLESRISDFSDQGGMAS